MTRRALRRRVGTWLRYLPFASQLRRRALLVVGTLIGLGIVWIAITGFLARQQAKDLAVRIFQVKELVAQGDVVDARRAGAQIPAMAHRVQHLTGGPAWWIGAHVPYLGEPLSEARDTAAAAAELGSHAVPRLLSVAADIDPGTLRSGGDTIRLQPLVRATPDLQAAAAVLHRVGRQLGSSSSSSWLSAVNTRRDELQAQVASMTGYVDAAVRATEVLPTMLGRHGVQRYFIGLQNESELRGTGGLPGAFAIARVVDGTVTFEKFESDAVLLPAKTHQLVPTGLELGSEYDKLYAASAPTDSYIDSNVSPNFPYAARIWAAMWRKVSGQRVDGVIAVDPTALSYFLAATGPTTVAQFGTAISQANVVSLTERDDYVLFPDNARRKAFLVAVLKAASRKLTSGAGAPLNLVRAASRSAGEHRLLVWSADPAVEKRLAETDFAGAIPQSSRPFAGLILNNAAAGKLDYYLDRTLTYSRTGCGARRDVVATIGLTNDAPATGLPPYVVGRADKPPVGAKPGDNHTIVDYYATQGALLQSVTVNGAPATASVQPIQGHPVFRLDLELPRGTTQTIVLHLDEPAGSGAPRIWRQPGVTPLAVQEFDQHCG